MPSITIKFAEEGELLKVQEICAALVEDGHAFRDLKRGLFKQEGSPLKRAQLDPRKVDRYTKPFQNFCADVAKAKPAAEKKPSAKPAPKKSDNAVE